jgi:DNA-nicking Smr family endonuclease
MPVAGGQSSRRTFSASVLEGTMSSDMSETGGNSDNARQRILRFIEEHGVHNKDARRRSRVRIGSHRKGGGERAARHRATLDLHGLTQDQAAHRLRMALERCRRNGVRSVLVIHGQGLHSNTDGAVLRELVRVMLDGECRELVRSYKTAPPRLGGDGATVVYLA